MANKPLWLKTIGIISLIVIILSVIGFVFFLFQEWGPIVSLGIFLPMGLFFLGIWIVGLIINWLINKKNKVVANLLAGILLLVSLVLGIYLFSITNLIVSAFYVFLTLLIILMIYSIFLLFIINKR